MREDTTITKIWQCKQLERVDGHIVIYHATSYNANLDSVTYEVSSLAGSPRALVGLGANEKWEPLMTSL